MAVENILLSLLEETQYLLEDIFLSGFHSIQPSSLEKLTMLKSTYEAYDMSSGAVLIDTLLSELGKRRSSFQYCIDDITEIYCKLEFYLCNAKSYIE